ncbi:PHOsphatase [Mortierella alpina]|nr:PHOsphatase [Mortierella alpina]
MAAVFILLILSPIAVDAGPQGAQPDSALKAQELCSSSTFDFWREDEPKRASGTVVFTLPDERLSPPRWSVESAALQGDQEDEQLAQPLAVIGGQEGLSQIRFSSPTSSPSDFSKKDPFPHSSWIRKHLASKSPYPHEDKKVGPVNDAPEGYELVQLHLVCRHGTRYPSASVAIALKALTEKARQAKVPGFEWLQRWSAEVLYPISKANLLAPQGDSDLYRIGHRFAMRYKEFLDQHPYDANTYEFHSSGKSRCSQSAYGFTVGFLEGRHADVPDIAVPKTASRKSPVQPVDISTLPIGMDTELAVRFACPRWSDNVKGQPKVVQEANIYKERVLPELVERLSTLFVADDRAARINFTTQDIKMIYTACGFEVSLYQNDKTWCQLLRLATTFEGFESRESHDREEDIKSTFLKLEINSDLSKYYAFGPGVPFNRHLGCKLGTSLLESIDLALAPDKVDAPVRRMKTSDDDDDEELGTPQLFRGHFKFGHSETIMFFSSFLGLYNHNGVPMTGSMTPEQYQEREFKTSELSPFAANMAFEVYRPSITRSSSRKRRLSDENEAPASPVSKGLVRMLINEEPRIIPGCGSDYFCEWATFKRILQRAGAGCDFEACCRTMSSSSTDAAPLTWLETMRRTMRVETQDECLAVDPIAG